MIVRKSELYLSLAFYLVATALAQTSGSSSSRDTSGSDSGQLPTGLEYDDDADPQEVAAGVVRATYNFERRANTFTFSNHLARCPIPPPPPPPPPSSSYTSFPIPSSNLPDV